jgi:hypothetical protein
MRRRHDSSWVYWLGKNGFYKYLSSIFLSFIFIFFSLRSKLFVWPIQAECAEAPGGFYAQAQGEHPTAVPEKGGPQDDQGIDHVVAIASS